MTPKPPPRNVLLRAATNEDAPAVQALVLSVLAEYGLEPDPDGTDSDLRDLESTYLKRGGAFHVLVSDSGRIVGCAGLNRIDETTCELRKMYLAPTVRGLGLGKWLLDDAVATARTLGFRRIVLETASVLREAIALYTRYGFTPYRSEHLSKRCNQAFALELDPRADGCRRELRS